jgi:hypothetical protein
VVQPAQGEAVGAVDIRDKHMERVPAERRAGFARAQDDVRHGDDDPKDHLGVGMEAALRAAERDGTKRQRVREERLFPQLREKRDNFRAVIGRDTARFLETQLEEGPGKRSCRAERVWKVACAIDA